MPSSISDRLKALGVQTGAQGLKPAPARQPQGLHALAEALGGHIAATLQGEALVIETRYPVGQPHGEAKLELGAPLDGVSAWSGQAWISELQPDEIAFLDTETTGLSGGTGTYAFLIGAGRFEGPEFVLHQYLLPDPSAEPAQLAALEAFLAPCRLIATFNGKAFDAPLLNARYTVQGQRPPLKDLGHIDLLHLARRLWRGRLPDRSLPNLEAHILGASRTELDLPGWMIPQVYFNYLQDRDPEPLKQVIYHNAMDVVSLAALLDHMAGVMNAPLERGGQFGVDLIALARLYEDLGDLERATALYIHGLEHEDARSERLPRLALLQALQHLALIYKRANDLEAAMRLWEQAAGYQHLESFVELAKCCEHQLHDPARALHWTQSALALIDAYDENPLSGAYLSLYQRRQWSAELQHRLDRLVRKLGGPP